MKRWVGFFTLLAAAAIFGSFGIWIRLLGKDLAPQQQIITRNIFALIISLAIFFSSPRPKPQKTPSNTKLHLILYSIFMPLAIVCFTQAMLLTKIGVATFMYYIGSIVFSTLFGFLFFREKFTWFKGLALLLVLAGLIVMLYPFEVRELSWGMAVAILGGIFSASANAFRKSLVARYSSRLLLIATFVGGIAVSAIVALATHESLLFYQNITTQAAGISLVFGILLVVVNYLLFVGFRDFDLSLGVIVVSAELVFAPVFSYLFLREQLTTTEIIGGILVGLAIVLPNLINNRSNAEHRKQ